MNNPEYILTDVFADIANKVGAVLNLPINYQYGYVTELNETLKQWEGDPEKYALKFPIIWLAQPFSIVRGEVGFYGKANGLDLFFIHNTQKTYKAAERMANVFKPVIYKVYRETLIQIKRHEAFSVATVDEIKHKITDFYYWEGNKKSVLNDIVDCMKTSFNELKINNNTNCSLSVTNKII